MRVLLFSLFIGIVLGVPQGYNYQLQPTGATVESIDLPSENPAGAQIESNDFTLEQYNFLQQYVQQQQQQEQQLQQQQLQELQLQFQQQQQQQQPQQQEPLQIITIKAPEPDQAAQQQTVTQSATQIADNGGYQFAGQLVQQAQQLVQYEHEQQQQQEQQLTQPESKQVYEIPAAELQTPQQQHQQEVSSVEVQQQQQHVEQHEKTQITETHPFIESPQQPSLPQIAQYTQPLSQPQTQSVAQPTYQTIQEQSQIQIPLQQPHIITIAPQPIYQRPVETPQPLAVQYNKEFFYLSAPQDDAEQPQNLQKEIGKIKKNIRVVFIKAPEQNGIANAALQLAKQSADQQTAIYVLTKQHDVSDLANKLQQVRAGSQAKPEVIFIKYKTPEEAEHAQRTIQAQYEALNGPNHFIHEGVVPSHNFIGSTSIEPRKTASTNSQQLVNDANTAVKPVSKYLPSAAQH